MIYRDGVKWSAAAPVFPGFQDVVEVGIPAVKRFQRPVEVPPASLAQRDRGSFLRRSDPRVLGSMGVNKLNRARSFSWPQSSPGSFYCRTWIPKYRPPNTKTDTITTTSQ